MTSEQITHNIALIPSYTDDQLIHLWKCAISNPTASEKKLLEPFIIAIEKARNSRHKAAHAEVLSKTEQPTAD